jgi:hypothetical protein
LVFLETKILENVDKDMQLHHWDQSNLKKWQSGFYFQNMSAGQLRAAAGPWRYAHFQ